MKGRGANDNSAPKAKSVQDSRLKPLYSGKIMMERTLKILTRFTVHHFN